MNNEVTYLNFECTHNTANRTMTCSWIGGRVQLVEYFALAKTYVVIDDNVKCFYEDLTIDEFIRLQCECQRVADSL